MHKKKDLRSGIKSATKEPLKNEEVNAWIQHWFSSSICYIRYWVHWIIGHFEFSNLVFFSSFYTFKHHNERHFLPTTLCPKHQNTYIINYLKISIYYTTYIKPSQQSSIKMLLLLLIALNKTAHYGIHTFYYTAVISSADCGLQLKSL